jgi:ABC-2 type transport system permease protein
MTPRLLLTLAGGEARRLMSYRSDFWITTVASFAVDIAVAWFVWAAIFDSEGQAAIGGYTREGMILYYLLALLLGRLVRGAEREDSIAEDIYSGQLTRYLLFPAGYFELKYAEHLGQLVPSLTQTVLFGGAALLFLDLASLGQPTLATVAATLVAVALGNLMSFLLASLVESIAFWVDNVWSLSVLMRFAAYFLGGQMVPLDLLPPWLGALTEILPFRFMFFFPAVTLTGRIGWAEWLGGIGLCAVWILLLALATRWVWRRGFLTYTGVGI